MGQDFVAGSRSDFGAQEFGAFAEGGFFAHTEEALNKVAGC